jgi:hypothetical protein
MHHFTVANVSSSKSCTDGLYFFLYQIFLHSYSITMGHFRPKHVACCQTIILFRKKTSIHLGGSSRSISIYETHREVIRQNILPCIRWFPILEWVTWQKILWFFMFLLRPSIEIPWQYLYITSRSLPSTSLLLHYHPYTLTNRGLAVNNDSAYRL